MKGNVLDIDKKLFLLKQCNKQIIDEFKSNIVILLYYLLKVLEVTRTSFLFSKSVSIN